MYICSTLHPFRRAFLNLHVPYVHVVDLSSSAGRHVLCCCISASCYPCACCRSVFLGRRTCSLLLCLSILLPMCMLQICLPRQEDMFIVVVSQHPVTHVHVVDLSSSAKRHVHCFCVSASCYPCACYRYFLCGRKTCYLLLCLGIMFPMYMQQIVLPRQEYMFVVAVSRHHVTHVQAINLSSSEGRHVLCCCVSASCFPCTCYISFFLGRKTCSLLLCLSIMFPMYML